MSDLTPEQAQARLGKGSPAHTLWGVLRADDAPRWGIGTTTASKILHRKRPHLIPIWDVVIGQVIGKRSSRNQWLNWTTLLQPGEPCQTVSDASTSNPRSTRNSPSSASWTRSCGVTAET